MKVQMKLAAALTAAVVCMQCITAMKADAWASSYELDYAISVQEKSNWCWAACAHTMAKYDVPTTTLTQGNGVYVVYGSIPDPFPNVPGTIMDVATAAEHISHQKVDYGVGEFNTISESHISRIVTGHVETFLLRDNDDIGHTVTLKAMYFAQDSSKYIKISDPGNGKDTTLPYTSFMNGGYHDATPITECNFVKFN